MNSSHSSIPKPSVILALVALGLVIRLEPSWAKVELQQAAVSRGVKPQTLSRLVTRAVTGFGQLLEVWTRRGRPPSDCRTDELGRELERVRALLQVATSLLSTVTLGRGQLREHIVGAYERLHAQLGINQQRFCEALSLPGRTLRSWLSKPRAQRLPTPPAKPRPKPKLKPRRGRFGFDVVLPSTMKAADTTALTVLGVELKLIAVQDVGGRDVSLLDGVLVGPTESAETVAKLMSECLEGREGAQMLTDQGTPYMAKHTVQMLDALEVEHAPQREGEPTGKATIERAFRSIKDAGASLFSLTNHLSSAHPQLREPSLAASLTHLIVEALLRAYQHGSRMARAAFEQRGKLCPEDLEQTSSRARQQAQAHDRSARLMLSEIHDLYDIGRDKKRFIDGLRRYPLPVLQQAEKEMSKQVHREDIRDRASYFAALVRRCHDDYRQQRARRQQEAGERRKREEHDRAVEQQQREYVTAPATMIRDALEIIASQWESATRQLLFGGIGPGQGMLHKAFAQLSNKLGAAAAEDIIRGVYHDFAIDSAGTLESATVDAIGTLLDRVTAGAVALATSPCVIETGGNQRTCETVSRIAQQPPILPAQVSITRLVEEHDRAAEQQQREHVTPSATMIRDALELIASQWNFATRQLLFGGVGPGQGMLYEAFAALSNTLGVAAAKDVVRRAFDDFAIDSACVLDSAAMGAIGAILDRLAGGAELLAITPCVIETRGDQAVASSASKTVSCIA